MKMLDNILNGMTYDTLKKKMQGRKHWKTEEKKQTSLTQPQDQPID